MKDRIFIVLSWIAFAHALIVLAWRAGWDE
jgi:hypothetical protein